MNTIYIVSFDYARAGANINQAIYLLIEVGAGSSSGELSLARLNCF